ncbi:MAG: threonine-phosphate decarboxylase CobD [Sphingobium phenoxybenzoativorans]
MRQTKRRAKGQALEPWRVHGGRLGEAQAAFPDAPRPLIDLSTGINPHAWDVTRAGPVDWTRLPDEGALAALESAAAAHFGVDAASVCAVPGSEMGLRMLDALALPAPFRHVAPSYGTHAEALPGSIAIAPDAAGAGNGTLLLANPNNPDGRLLPAEHLRALMAKGETLVVDEAFADAVPGASLLGGGVDDRLVVLRSFGKFFGLAGLRLGFVIAAPARLAPLRRRLGSWPVSAAAIAIGTAAYRDDAWIANMRAQLLKEATRLDALLHAHGLEPQGACPLFRLIRVEDAGALFDRLARRGILTRPFDYAPDWLRIGLPADDAAYARLDAALGAALADG